MIGGWSTATLLFAYFAGQRAAVNMLLFLSTALFLSRAGVERLPIVYILINAVSISIQMWSSANPQLSSYAMLRRVSNAMIAGTLAAPFILWGGGSTAAAILVVFALQIAVRVFEILSGTLFLNIVNEVYPLREAKERIPRLLAVSSASIVVAGLIVRPLTAFLTVEGTIFGTAVLLVLDQIVLKQIGRVLKTARGRAAAAGAAPSPEDEAARVAAEDAAGEGAAGAAGAPPLPDASGTHLRPRHLEAGSGIAPRPEELATARGLFASPLVSAMVSVAFVVSFLKFLQDFQYSAALAREFKDQSQLAAFLGYYESAITVLIIGAQTMLTGPVLRRLKLGVAVSLLPAVMIVTCLAGAAAPTLAMIIGAKVVYTLFSNAFYNPAGSLLVGPLSKSARDRARMAVSTATSMGCLVIGVALQIGLKNVSASMCFTVMAVLYLLALVLARRLDRAYLGELSRELSAADVKRKLENVRALRVVSQTYAAARILELLSDPDPDVRERAVREVKFLGPYPAKLVLERVMAGGTDPRVRASALREVVGVLGEEALAFAVPQLSDPDRRVQANALEAVAAVANEAAVRTLTAFIESPDHRLRAIAAVGLVRASSDEATLTLGLSTLAKMAKDAEVLMRATAAVAMGELAYPFFVGALAKLAGDANDQVAERAIEALEKMHAGEAAVPLARLAQRPELARRAARLEAACRVLEDQGSAQLLAVMESLSGEERARLREHLKDVRHSVRAQVLGRALSLASPDARQAVVAYLHRATHPGAPALVAACLAGEEPSIAPALDAMRSGHYRGEEAISRLLVGFMNAENAALLRAYLREVWQRVRATIALTGRWPAGSLEDVELSRRRARLLAHGFALVGLLTRKPRQVVESLEKALEGDRFVSSLSQELVSARVGPEASAELLPLLDDLRVPERWKEIGAAVPADVVEAEGTRLVDYLRMIAEAGEAPDEPADPSPEDMPETSGWEGAPVEKEVVGGR